MGAKAEESRVYNVTGDRMVAAVRRIPNAGLNISLTSENPTPTGVWFRFVHGMSFRSYGEKITVTLTPHGPTTDVHILSECGMPTQIIDYGKNRSNVSAIFQFIDSDLGVVPPAQAQQQFAQPAPQAAPQTGVQAGVKYCPKCGRQAAADANFCAACGNKL